MNHENKNHMHQPEKDAGSAISFACGADKFSYAVLAGIPFGFSAIFTYFMLFGGRSAQGVWSFALLGYAILMFVLAYLILFRVAVRDGRLEYRTLLRGTQSIRLEDIKAMRIDIKLLRTPAKRPPYALMVEPKADTNVKGFAINMKFPSRANLRTLLEILGDKVVGAKDHRLVRR